MLAAAACSGFLIASLCLLWLRFNVAPGRTGAPFPADFLLYFVPMTDWVAQRLRAGELPLWNPHACSGMPLLATLQPAVFHPATWLTLWLPTARALPLAMALQTALAAHLAALLFRAWGCGWLACAAGGLLFAFGCVLGTSFWPPALATLVWTPAILLCIEKLVVGWRWRWWLALALATALQLVAGFTQYAVFTWYLAAPYIGVRLLAGWRERNLSTHAALARLAGLAAAIALGAGLAAVQLLPTLELVAETHRAKALTPLQVHYGAIGTALPLGGLLRNALDPSPGLITAGYGYDQGYLGMATVVLLAAGIVSGRRGVTVLLAAVALVSLLLSDGYAGPGAPLYALFAQLPTGSTFRDPQRFRVLTFFCVIALAVPGFDAFARGFADLRGRRAASGFALAGALGVSAAAGAFGGPGALVRALAVLALCACVWRWPRREVRGVASALLLAGLAADLWGATRPGSGSLRAVPTAWVEHLHLDAFTVYRGSEVEALQHSVGFARLAFPDFEPTLGLGALGRSFRVECLDPLAPAGWNELQERLSGKRDPRILMAQLPAARLATAYDLAGVRAIGTLAATSAARARARDAAPSRAAEAAGPDPGLPPGVERRLDPNPDALPRAYLVESWQRMSRSLALAHVAEGDFDFRREVILERDPSGLARAPDPPPARAAEIVEYAAERVEIALSAEQPALLVLSDTYFPGWVASVDGVEAEILLANGLFRAVPVPAGARRVRFEYRPNSLRRGAALAGASAILLCVIPLAARRRARSG